MNKGARDLFAKVSTRKLLASIKRDIQRHLKVARRKRKSGYSS